MEELKRRQHLCLGNKSNFMPTIVHYRDNEISK